MDRNRATIGDIVATFSEHLSKSFPSPGDFRRNFDALLWEKRDRSGAEGYVAALEKNIVYLDSVIDEALSLAGRLLDSGEAPDERDLSGLIGDIERRAHRSAGERHDRAFVKLLDPAFATLAEGRAAGGPKYVETLEFNYRYLMTLRLFLLEFVSVVAAVRADYGIERAPEEVAKIRGQIEIFANYYLGNVSVAGEDGGPSETAPEGQSFS